MSPVTVPALTTIVDTQFKEDRTLCPVRALRYYLDRTKDLRGSQSLLFISFKKRHQTRYSFFLVETNHPTFFMNKQTNKPWTWSKLKRMTSGPSRPLRPFTVGYQWTKSCKPVTGKLTTHFKKFYLKDLTWSDNDNNMYLGPVVAAQQVLDPSPQTSHPQKERKGGGGNIRYSQVFRSLIPGSRYRFTFEDVTGKVILYF